MFSMGIDAEMLVYYVRSGKALFWVTDPHRYAVNDDGKIVLGRHPPPTRSEVESMRRALRNLGKQGLILATLNYRHVIYMTPGKRSRSG